MFLTVHAVAGIVVAESVTSKLAGFLLGVVSHLLLDLIPHGDAGLNKWVKQAKHQERLRIMLATFLDLFVLTMLTMAFLPQISVSNPYVTGWTVIGALLPDFVWGLAYLVNKKIKLLNLLAEAHHKFQNLIKDRLSLKTGTVVQLITVTLLIWLQINLLK